MLHGGAWLVVCYYVMHVKGIGIIEYRVRKEIRLFFFWGDIEKRVSKCGIQDRHIQQRKMNEFIAKNVL